MTPRKACFGLALLLLAGCATNRVLDQRNYAYGQRLPQPDVVLVYPFGFDPERVIPQPTGRAGPAAQDGIAAPEAARAQAGHEAATALADEIVVGVRKLGMSARRANQDTRIPMHALLLDGEFVGIDEGDRAKRTFIGFGQGASRVRVKARLWQQAEDGPRLVAEGDFLGSSGEQVPIVGQVTGAVVEGGSTGLDGSHGASRAEARRTARELVKRLETIFREQRWI